MARQSIPVLNLQDYLSDAEARKNKFVQGLGEALVDIGFFSLTGHGIDLDHIDKAYAMLKSSFLSQIKRKPNMKIKTVQAAWAHPIWYRSSKGNPPDLKEFWQTGRTLDEDNPHFDDHTTQCLGRF